MLTKTQGFGRNIFFNSPKPLAKRTRKSTQVFELRSSCVSFVHPRAWTQFARKSTQVFHRLATQRKSTQVDCKWLYYMIQWNLQLFVTCVNFRADLRIRLATLRKSVPPLKFWFCKLALTCESVWPPFAVLVLQTCVDLCGLVSPFGLLVSRSGRTPCARTSVTVIQGTPHFDLRPISLTTLCGITSVLGIGY